MKFTAFDFEIANSTRSSACAIGLVQFENGNIVRKEYSLIKPKPNEFNSYYTTIHGINANDVESAPTFDALWPKIEPMMQDTVLVAHNASFDISVLRKTLEQYRIPFPKAEILCTCKIAQVLLPTMLNFRLSTLCEHLGIALQHHYALSDAEAAAQLLFSLMQQHNIDSVFALENLCSFTRGYLDKDSYEPFHLYKNIPNNCILSDRRTSAKDYSSILSDYIDDDFVGKKFVFTGTLMSMSRAEAYEIVARGGGTPQDRITMQTNYLVVGLIDYHTSKNGLTGKMKKAYEYKTRGQDIQIIVEDDFTSMIDEELYKMSMKTRGVNINVNNKRF